MQQPCKRLKLENSPTGSPITNFRLHVYRGFTEDEKEKCLYQDTICSEAEESPWEVLYDNVVDPDASLPSKETSGAFLLMEKNISFGFSGMDNYCETYPLALTYTILCLPVIFGTLL